VVSLHVVTVVSRVGYMIGGTGRSCRSTECDEAEGVGNRGAVACSLCGGSPFRPPVSARMRERL
jgi:hypothetical protein